MEPLADSSKPGITPEHNLTTDKNTVAADALEASVQPQPVAKQVEENAPTLRDQPKITGGTGAVIRENFSFPPGDSELIEILRKRAAREGVLLNRSELLRAGLAALSKLSDAEIAAIGGQVPKLKTGRPKSA